ncbi:restriction endonuclease subunit S [Latilactobacillus curvatus]|uniref:restriction endonuclease subunit S n=1 Tax=Latilactobacillus curvatus TaxID=28038 RepID=UPI0039AF4FA7
MSNKVPQIRFNGYSDAWEERKLGEISKTTIGEFVIKTKQSDESPYPVYNGGRSYTGKYDEYNNDGPKIVISARGANAGFVNYVSGRYWAGNSCYSVSVTKEDEFSIGYLYQFIKYNQVLFTAYQQAANIPSVSKSDVEKFSIKYPTVLEQKKIESFFKQLDNTIALHQRKLDLLKEQKKGYLQKMFPKNGEKVPELRFEGFADDWEERKLSEIGKIVTGNTPSTSNKGYYNGDFLFVSPADIQENRYVNKTTTTLTELGFKTGRLVPKGATLFVSIGSTIGKIGQSICDVITNQQINSVISFSDYDDDFIYTSILNSSTKIKQLAATQAVPIINKNEFGKSIIKIPSLEEQQKIGSFFKQLDDTIALHQRKLDLLKEQKKGFLQNMFV